MRIAASRTFWTAGSSRPIRTAIMAITTSSSMRVKADGCRRADREEDIRPLLSARPGKRVRASACQRRVRDGEEQHSARAVARGRSTGAKLDRQVFWLTARSGPRVAFPGRDIFPYSPSGLDTRGPGRSQRRPRNGLATFSLLSPDSPGGDGDLSRTMILT